MKKITALVCSLLLTFSFMLNPATTFAVDPVVTINDLETADSIPTLRGTIDDPNFYVLVSCAFLNSYADVDDNGNWQIAASSIVEDGTYPISATAIDPENEEPVGEPVYGTLTLLDDYNQTPVVDLPEFANSENQTAVPINGEAEPFSYIYYYVFDQNEHSVFVSTTTDSSGFFSTTVDVSELDDGQLRLMLYSIDNKENRSENYDENFPKDTQLVGEIVTPVPLHGNDYNPPITLNIEKDAFWRIDYDYGNLAMGWGTGENQTEELIDLPIGNYKDLVLTIADPCNNVKVITLPEFNIEYFAVDAGPDMTADSEAVLNGTVDPSDHVESALWQKISGPGNIFFSPIDLLSASVRADKIGTYILELLVQGEDGYGSASDQMSFTWEGEGQVSIPEIFLPSSIISNNLSLLGHTDPNCTIMYYLFDQNEISIFSNTISDVDGNFEINEDLSTLSNGQIRLLAYAVDAQGNMSDPYDQLVDKEVQLISITVDAGQDITTDEPISVTATVTPSDDIQSIKWEKISGPGNINFDPDNALTTIISADQAGDYVLRITVQGSDPSCVGTDEINFTLLNESNGNGQGGNSSSNIDDVSSTTTTLDSPIVPATLISLGSSLPEAGLPAAAYLLSALPLLFAGFRKGKPTAKKK